MPVCEGAAPPPEAHVSSSARLCFQAVGVEQRPRRVLPREECPEQTVANTRGCAVERSPWEEKRGRRARRTFQPALVSDSRRLTVQGRHAGPPSVTPKEGNTSAASVGKPVVRSTYLWSTRDYTPEKSRTNAANVGGYLAINPTFSCTK